MKKYDKPVLPKGILRDTYGFYHYKDENGKWVKYDPDNAEQQDKFTTLLNSRGRLTKAEVKDKITHIKRELEEIHNWSLTDKNKRVDTDLVTCCEHIEEIAGCLCDHFRFIFSDEGQKQ